MDCSLLTDGCTIFICSRCSRREERQDAGYKKLFTERETHCDITATEVLLCLRLLSKFFLFVCLQDSMEDLSRLCFHILRNFLEYFFYIYLKAMCQLKKV